ncbi:MAG: methyltransferase domain-containing protein [Alphaproteobacteria bacterium]
MADTPACQVCCGTESRHFIHVGGMDIYECLECGLVYLHPAPTEEEIRERYNDAKGATVCYFAKVESKMRRSRRRARHLAHMLGPGSRRRLLDVGCSGGFMVEAAREQGFEASGIDLDPVSIAYAREHYPDNHFFRGTIEEFAPGREPFDTVYCSEVVEHVPDANRFVAEIAGLMRPGAVLYLTTPDISHWRRPKNVLEWNAFVPPQHCLYFGPKNLALLLRRHGLDVFRRRIAWKPGIKLFARRRPD